MAALDRRVRPPLWRDVRVLRVVGQLAFLVVLVAIGTYLWGNLTTNMRRTGLPTGFEYLDRPAGFSILDSDFRGSGSNLSAIVVGIRNTIAVSAVGILLATIIGIVIGVARLSTNWLVRKAAATYVEALRNVPVLLVIFFFSLAVIGQALPRIEQAWQVPGWLVVSNRAIGVPWVVRSGDGDLGTWWAGAAAAVLAGLLVGWWRTRRSDRTGRPHHRVLWGGATTLVLGAVAFLAAGSPLVVSGPVLEGRLIVGGIDMTSSYVALLLGLTLYTASHIAEIVRGAILAVPKGQTEAATALGLTPFQRLRFVILPQAFRILLPPLGNQYLNLTKNSSLAVAIGFQEITTVTNTIIGNGNPATQSIAILMAIYLTFSLTISAVTNTINRRLQLATRR